MCPIDGFISRFPEDEFNSFAEFPRITRALLLSSLRQLQTWTPQAFTQGPNL